MKETRQNIKPYTQDIPAVFASLEAHPENGLSQEEAEKRFQTFGPNKIAESRKKSLLLTFLSQFSSPLVWLLFGAAGISVYFSEWLEAIAILIVVLINAGIGFYMEAQAEKSMKSLKKLSAVPAKVIRNKILHEINAESIVPGDIVYVEAGDVIPADGRIFKETQLKIDESTLTGESITVTKIPERIPETTPLAERTNMLFKGTHVTNGNGHMLVTETGMKTELGKIADMVQEAEQASTPLEKKLEGFSRVLMWITLALVTCIFIVGLLNGKSWIETLETSVALAVATIPEGLPIVATLALARGMLKMAKFKVIVKKLSAVETLGGTTVICTDKTGTLTENKIDVNKILVAHNTQQSQEIIYRIAVLCNTAEIQNEKEIGDPLEVGLLQFAQKNNVNIQQLRSNFPRTKEIPFSSETKMMATQHKSNESYLVYAKGAPEEILKRSNYILENNTVDNISESKRKEWIKQADELSATGLKVIAGAYKTTTNSSDKITDNLVFVGLFGLIDPPRKDVNEAIKECKSAGIEVIMITGDHPATAKNIAREINLLENENESIITGNEMKDYASLTKEDKEVWRNTKVFARVSPKQKLDLISVLQEQQNIVGMTGDGVNDAPALKKADIGIAMGIRGTQVSQEAADMILKDDSFNSIVIAVRQGRIIFENIRKFVIYLLSCNLSELFVIASAAILNLHFQLFPLQILFINLITDVLPALALGFTKGSDSIMQIPPRKSSESIIDKKRWKAIAFYSTVIAAVSIAAVELSHATVHQTEGWNRELCNNILFFTLIFSQLLHVFNMGDAKSGFFTSEVFRNKYVWGAIALSLLILVVIYSFIPLRTLLSLYHLSIYDWLIAAGASVVSVIIIQLFKKAKFIQH